jgi:hypothetical protein
MSMRGLVVALLCGVLGLGIGIGVAYLAQPQVSKANSADPVTGISPSVPIDPTTGPSYAQDIRYPTLSPDLPLPPPAHTIGNELATWTYHIPAGWQAYAVCPPGACPPQITTDTKLTPQAAARQPQVRFRPPDEPVVGGYSIRVEALDNTSFNPEQMVATKIVGFRQAFTDFSRLRKTDSAVYFTYVTSSGHLRYNYFQWFAVPGSSSATLEMSVAGRSQDVPGLKALFNRFADNVVGTADPYRPAQKRQQGSDG